MTLAIVTVLLFIFSSALQAVQTGFNEQLKSTNWASAANWDSFNLANTLVNNLWKFSFAFLILGIIYYGYVEAQRRT